MKAFLKKLYGVLEDFARWFWNKFNPPDFKDWCAIFYFVAQKDAGLSYPEPDLDAKLAVTINVLKAAATAATFDSSKMHVVYRAVWAQRDPDAAVISSSILPPSGHYFDDCAAGVAPIIHTSKDLRCFLSWAYKWCPAKHYAIFFWGHSFGPAGLFEVGANVGVVAPTGLAGLKKALDEFNAQRLATPRAKSASESSKGTIAADFGYTREEDADATKNTLDQIARAKPQVEIVLFQDCWMSTLETAFELADVVANVVASQSLLPIGFEYADFVWPYSDLLANLLDAKFAGKTTERIIKFYEDEFAKSHIKKLTTIPVALLDLTGVKKLATLWTSLSQALQAGLKKKEDRWLLIMKGNVFDYDRLTLLPLYGDAALMDVRKMCEEMKRHPDTDIKSAATDVLNELSKLVKKHAECLAIGHRPRGFGGVSVLYRPPPGEILETLITDAIVDASYNNLELIKQTGWPGIEQK